MAKMAVVIVGNAAGAKAAMAEVAASAQAMDAKVSGASARFAAAGRRMSTVGKQLTRQVSLPLAAIGGVAVYSAVKFQNAMELLHTQAGLAQGSIDGLSKSVLALAGPTATAPDMLAAGLYHLTSQGLRDADSLRALEIAAKGAKMGQANLEDVTNALGAAIASGIKGVHDYSNTMGVFNATVGAGDMRMQDLADAMGANGLAVTAKQFGVNITEVGGALAVFGDNLIRGAKAGTLLGTSFRLMGAPSDAAAKHMADFGLSAKQLSDTLQNQGLVPALQLVNQTIEKLGGPNSYKAKQFLTSAFGGKQSAGVRILAEEVARLQSKIARVTEGGAQFAKDWQSYTQTTAYKMSQMGASMQAAGVTIGTILLPYVSRLVNFISGLVQRFDKLSPTTKKVILVLAGVAAVIGPLTSMVGALSTAISFLVANPMALLVAGVAALAGAMALAVLKPALLKQGLEKLGFSAKDATNIIRGLQGVFQDLKTTVQYVAAAIEAIWARWGSTIKKVAETEWNLIKNTIRNDLEVIKGIVDVISGLMTGNWRKTWQGIKEIVGGYLSQVRDQLSAAVGVLGAVATRIGYAIWNGLKAGATVIINWIIGQLNHLVNAYNAVLGWLTGNINAIPTIGGHSRGHNPTAGTGMSGPLGPGKHGASRIVIQNHVHLDGKEIHQSMRKHDLRGQGRGNRALRDRSLYDAVLADS